MNQILKTPVYNKIYYDFVAHNPKVLKFLPLVNSIDWIDKAKKLLAITAVQDEVKKILIEQNKDLSSPLAIKYLRNLRQSNSIIIVTGQQLGILASPLYTIYKAITALKLADKLNKLYSSINFIPVFWLESADHDFHEVNKTGVWNKDLIPKIIIYQGEERRKTSLHHYTLEDRIYNFSSELRQHMIQTEFTERLFEIINGIWKEGVNWVTAARGFLKFLFEEFGLLFFNPGDIKIKKLAVPFYTTFLGKIEDISRAFSSTSLFLLKEGYTNQIKDVRGKAFLHIEDQSYHRDPLYYNAKKFYTKGSKKNFTLSEIVKIINKNPEKVTTSVVSRPLLQSWLIPTLVYIAGPAEIAYWAQLGTLFEQMQLNIPVIFPRISATIIEPRAVRYANTYRVDLETIDLNYKKYLNIYLKRSLKNSHLKEIANLKNIIEREFNKIDPFIKELDPTLLTVSSKKLKKIKDHIEDLENKILDIMDFKEDRLIRHLKLIHNIIFPQRKIQERVINIVYYINKFGFKTIRQLLDGLELDNYNHQLLKL
jgi:bacillithiol biosynthesis cysteine-adding enzyme BshC